MDQPLKREFNVTSTNYGVNVACHAGQSFREPDFAAGKSKRITASYQKTGTSSNRAEEGFRDTKGPVTLTEDRKEIHYGTMRDGLRATRTMPMTGSMVLHGYPRPITDRVETMSVRSGASGRSGRSNRSQGAVSQRSQGAGSQRSQGARSGASSVSRASHASRAPSWFQENNGPAWNFEPLPMYERTNESYGKVHNSNFQGLNATTHQAAGKSESGWLEPSQLIQTLTRPHPGT